MKQLSLSNCRLDQRYDVFDTVGRGSYAEIFLAREIDRHANSPSRTVVIKALNVFLQDSLDEDLERTLVENFQNEAVALDRVRHPNIISRLGHGTARDLEGTVFHYIVLEYMAGGDLQTRIRRQRLSLGEAVKYIQQACEGLSHAHSRGVIHRDIKPQNLLLSADEQLVKIADFGVARLTELVSPVTRVGTNIYAPPEHSPVFSGQTANLAYSALTPAADVYSLAKTAYALITGESPRAFAHGAITELDCDSLPPDLRSELLGVLRKATQDDPRHRYGSIDEFWNAFSGVLVHSEARDSLDESWRAALDERSGMPAAPAFETVARNPSKLTSRLENPPFSGEGSRVGVRVDPAGGSKVAVPHTRSLVLAGPRSFFRRATVFGLSILVFAGLLYGTANYMRGRGILPEISNPFAATRTAVANTDIYLRPSPNTSNEPIGLVTRNSRVRILGTQNNWHQVEVLEQGRVRPEGAAKRGWLNGKYLEFSN
jgi:serine/threonine protein kinase